MTYCKGKDMAIVVNYGTDEQAEVKGLEPMNLPGFSNISMKDFEKFRDSLSKQICGISSKEFRVEFKASGLQPTSGIYKIYINAVIKHEDCFCIKHDTKTGFFKDKGIFVHDISDSMGYNLCELMFNKEPLIIEYY